MHQDSVVHRRLSRRSLVRRGIATTIVSFGTVGLLGACAAPAPQTGAPPPATSAPSQAAAPASPQAAAPKVEPQAKAEPKTGGTLTVAVAEEPATLDINFGSADSGARNLSYALWSRLVKPNPATGELVPDAAVEWKSVDPTTWQFTLRDGIRFHNGEPLDAQSVKASIEYTVGDKTPATSTAKLDLADFAAAEAPNPRTVMIRTKQPAAAFPSFLSRMVLYPAKYLAEQAPEVLRERPVGSGPFKFTSWSKGSTVTMERFDGYFGEKAKLDRVVFKTVTDKNIRVAGLQSGETQVATDIDPDDVAGLKGQGLQIAAGPIGESWLLNIKPTPGSPIDDVRVRRAFNHAIDRDALVSGIFLGLTRKVESVVGPDGFGYNPDIKGYAYDLNLARSLLKEAGYENGFDIELDAATVGGVKAVDVAQYLVGQLQRVGIRVKLNLMERAALVQRIVGGGGAPLYLAGIMYAPAMDSLRIISRFPQTRPYKRFYTTPEMEKLIQEALGTFDNDKRRDLQREILKQFSDLAGAAPLYQALGLHGLAKNVRGFA